MPTKTTLQLIIVSILLLLLFSGCDERSNQKIASVIYSSLKFIALGFTFGYFLLLASVGNSYDTRLFSNPIKEEDLTRYKKLLHNRKITALYIFVMAGLPLIYGGYWLFYKWPNYAIFEKYYKHENIFLILFLLSCFMFLCALSVRIIKLNLAAIDLKSAEKKFKPKD